MSKNISWVLIVLLRIQRGWSENDTLRVRFRPWRSTPLGETADMITALFPGKFSSCYWEDRHSVPQRFMEGWIHGRRVLQSTLLIRPNNSLVRENDEHPKISPNRKRKYAWVVFRTMYSLSPESLLSLRKKVILPSWVILPCPHTPAVLGLRLAVTTLLPTSGLQVQFLSGAGSKKKQKREKGRHHV